MRFIFRTTRWLVTASLMVSLGLTGLFPQMSVWADGGMAISAPKKSNCCCGTETGSCCGMACCAVRAPSPTNEPMPIPAKDDNRNGRSCPLAIALANAMTGSGGNGQGASIVRSSSDADRSLAESSLQAKHVRLDA